MSKIESLKKLRQETVLPDDLIMEVLIKMDGGKIPRNRAVFHKAVYSLKKEPEYSDLLGRFEFDEFSLTPFSDELDSVLFRLEASHILGTLNPSYETYDLSQLKDPKLEARVASKFSPETREVISRMSKDFERLIS